MQSLQCKLVDALLNVVASGYIINTKGSLIHWVELGSDNYRVFVTEAIVRDALMPILVPNVMDVVEEALGLVVA